MTDLPHFAWPLRLVTLPDGSSSFAEAEQDTAEDLASSAAVIACTPRGHRDDDPTFGVTSPVFTQGPIDTDLLAAELAQADDRLDYVADEIVDLAEGMRRTITVHTDPNATP